MERRIPMVPLTPRHFPRKGQAVEGATGVGRCGMIDFDIDDEVVTPMGHGVADDVAVQEATPGDLSYKFTVHDSDNSISTDLSAFPHAFEIPGREGLWQRVFRTRLFSSSPSLRRQYRPGSIYLIPSHNLIFPLRFQSLRWWRIDNKVRRWRVPAQK
jgi:hypothetical protein